MKSIQIKEGVGAPQCESLQREIAFSLQITG